MVSGYFVDGGLLPCASSTVALLSVLGANIPPPRISTGVRLLRPPTYGAIGAFLPVSDLCAPPYSAFGVFLPVSD